ncbi:MAG: TetR/AcrR family transcriptional regulator [Candidatus Methanomethylophilaceae archaeon]|nr:TetR/AcrR family transcriptional regulator [Candidatus Methanomethylophilaceae archaeon]
MEADERDLRIVRTEGRLIEAFLRLKSGRSFKSITVSDLCREAGVSRATFYNRFDSMEGILDAAIDSVLGSLPAMERCINAYRWSGMMGGEPLCVHVRSHPELHGLFYDVEMHGRIVERKAERFSEESWRTMSRFGDLTREQYMDFVRCQLAGCLSAMASKAGCSDEEWSGTRKVIDDMALTFLNNHTV